MSYTSSIPTNLIKLVPPGLRVIPTAVVCGITLKYVKLGDLVDHENHRNVLSACKCLAGKTISWSRAVGVVFR
jgi:hypothetical protein